MDLMPTHQVQRWKIDMMRYDFTAIHRPEYMLCECNLLSRYNQHAEGLRKSDALVVPRRDAKIEEKFLGGRKDTKGKQGLAARWVWFTVIPEVNPQEFPGFAAMIKDFSKASRS